MIYLKERDKNIIKHIEKYGFLTTKQASKIFYKGGTYSYKEASRRLKQLWEEDVIRRGTTKNCNEYIYYRKKKPSNHYIILMDFYSALHDIDNLEIKLFEPEKWWLDGKIKSDAWLELRHKNQTYIYLLEIELNFKKRTIKKYEDLYKTNILQDLYKKRYGIEIFPKILVVSNYQKLIFNSELFEVVPISLKFDNLQEKLFG